MRVRIGLTLLVVLFLVGSLPFPDSTITQHNHDSFSMIENSEQITTPSLPNFRIADHTESGLLDPLTIEQTGNWTTGITHADSAANTGLTPILEVDSVNDWVGSEAYVDLWNLERLYIANGSLDDGIEGQNLNPTGNAAFGPYGWDAISYSSDGSQQMIAEYTPDQNVIVRSKGPGSPGNYQFRDGSYVFWVQNVTNTPHLDQFIFNLDYSYDKGPLNENISLRVLANDTLIWNVTSDNLEVGVPYSTGDLLLDFTGFSGQFELKIGLYFNDNLTHSQQFIEFTFDNIRLVGQTPPDFDDLDIDLTINSVVADVTGTSYGTASIANSSLWTENVPIELTSTLPVSFDYNASILNHRYINSTYELNPSSQGVTFFAQSESGISLNLYTYYGSLSDLVNFSIIIHHPSDWENVTVLNPFLTDVTSSCYIHSDFVRIPSNQLYTLGWWGLTLSANNYMKSNSLQKSTTGTEPWSVQTVFNTSEYIRAASSIGYGVENPVIDDPMNVSLYFPNGTLWNSELITGDSGDILNSTAVYLDSSNTTVGVWIMTALWQNGTEVAYGEIYFEVHHASELVAADPYIETDSGTVYRTSVQFKDTESNEFIMDASSVIVANWSGSTVTFEPNINQNSWDANFDTSIVGAGAFTVIVNATGTYHHFAQTSFVIVSFLTDNTVDIAVTSAVSNLQENYTVDFTFKDSLSVGIPSADVTIDYDGPASGLMWGDVDDLGSGNYRVNVTASISGSYSITITANGTYYESAKDVFVLDVGYLAASLDSQNGSVTTIGYGQSYRLVLSYTNGSGHALVGADVGSASIVPATGLSLIGPVDHGDGNYSFILSPDIASTYTVLFEANITNHDRELFTFTISVTDLSSILTIDSSDEFIDIDQNSTLLLRYENDTGHGIEGATFQIISPPTELTFSNVVDLGGGYYELIVSPTQVGQYQLRFKASATNYLDATAATPLTVTLVDMELVIEDPQTEYSTIYGTVYEIPFYLQRLNQSGDAVLNITDAIYDIEILGIDGLNWSIIQEDEHFDNFVLTLQADVISSWEIIIRASKDLHDTTDLSITFSVLRISTDINDFESRNFIYGMTYQYSFEYVVDSDDSHIGEADLIFSGSGFEFITWEETESSYILTLTPLDTGTYTVNIQFLKDGHQSQTSSIDFVISRVPVTVTTANTRIWGQFNSLQINVSLSITDLNQTLTNASVILELYSDGAFVLSFTTEEIEPGVYSDTIEEVYWRNNRMIIQVVVQKQYHLAASTEIVIDTIEATAAELIFRNRIPISVISVLSLSAVLGIVSTRRRNRKLRREALEVKSTFDDANNLLGVLILHKNSGLPFYSKILKGGFEEGMLSAFVTAVTHFRSEFENNGAEREWKLTPISDIIRAGATRNLICAFVTMTSPSLVHEAKMVMFTREMGLLLDDQMEVPPTEFRDDETGKMIEDMFDDYLDGALLKEYRIPVEGALPRKYRCISEARAVAGLSDTFSLSELSRGLEACGIEEAKGYKLLNDAVEDGQLWPIDKDDEDFVPGFSA
jgi:hypothetical protein